MKMSKFKLAFIVTLCVLTLTVLAYNFYFRNIPSEMYMQAWKWAEGFPDNYTDLTDDLDFRIRVFDYVKESVSIGEPMRVFSFNTGKDWFQEIYDSNWSHDIDIEYGGNFYSIQTWYQKTYYPSLLEHAILWSINVSTLALWALFIMLILPSKAEGQKENRNVVEYGRC